MNKAREFDQSVVAELKTLLGERVSTSAAVREHHGKDESYFPYAPPDVGRFCQNHRRGARCGEYLPPPSRADDPVRRRHLARGPHPRGAGRRVHRPVADEPGARGARGGPRRGGAGRRDAQAAERAHQAHGALLPDRPRRRRHARRHGGDARLGHQRGALRHDARERALAQGGAGRRPHYSNLAARAKNPRRATTSRASSSARKARSASSPR